MQEISNAQKLRLELLWWLLTGLFLALVLAPVYIYTEGYPFWRVNIIYIVTFVTVARYIFLLPTTFLAKMQWLKVALICATIPAIFLLIQESLLIHGPHQSLVTVADGPQLAIQTAQSILGMFTFSDVTCDSKKRDYPVVTITNH